MKRLIKTLAAVLTLLLAGLALAAPLPFARPARPLTEAQLRAWLARGPVVMTWRGATYHATFGSASSPSDYACRTHPAGRDVWFGEFSIFSQDGKPHIWVHEYAAPSGRAGPCLQFIFPVMRQPCGKIGGPMDAAGDCYLRRVPPPRISPSPEGR